ncbi:MAG: MgtC/SapB family protein [Candidatus Brennerbacteria bacterium]|nr:MgtC/SapB family protein [Candidatus Brennerbacteria bacterium]
MELIGSNWEVLIRLIVAMVLGGLLGFERELAGKTAGLRTYSLISVGAALYVVISQVVAEQFSGVTSFDPLRVASSIVVGIGFVGAGMIIFKEHEHTVKGLTTAAGIWVAAGIGMASGFGLYAVALFATLIALFIFIVLYYVDRQVRKGELKEFRKKGNVG